MSRRFLSPLPASSRTVGRPSSQALPRPTLNVDDERELYARTYRAHVEATVGMFDELSVFVEADSHREADDRVRFVCAALLNSDQTLEELVTIHETRNAIEIFDAGSSAVQYLRLFEKALDGDGRIQWIRAPIFALRDPVDLMQKWCAMPVTWRRRK
jgi:hypothetical protein